jgi:hypothetical protein
VNKDIKERWLIALRSGEYHQGKEWLKNDGNFCCLGVLCDLHAKETGTYWEALSDNVGSYMESSETLPAKVQEWAGLPHTCGASLDFQADEGLTLTRDITELNDSGHTFKEIADLIEEQL